jgi:hypothetical protein
MRQPWAGTRAAFFLAIAVAANAANAQPAAQKTDDRRDADIFGAPSDKKPENEKPTPPAQPEKPAQPDKPAPPEEAAPGRPSDADIFGTPATPTQPVQGTPPAAATPEASRPVEGPSTDEAARDRDLMSGGPSRLTEEAAPEDPLRIGGMFYLRTFTSARQGDTPNDWTFSAPSLLDAYMDARPNDRVRGLVLARMLFDPTLPAVAAPVVVDMDPVGDAGTVGAESMGTSDLSALFVPRTRGPSVFLDQMWLRFDLGRTVFVTAGKQHVRWGTGRFWTPTDFLHIRRRNPLDVFDARTGTTMLKLHFPWEARGWNFYAYGIYEDAGPTPRLGDIAGAARAEIVLGSTEIGAGALVKSGQKPRIGIDISTGLWEFDVYGEMALRYGSEIDRVTYNPNATFVPGERLMTVVERVYPTTVRNGIKAQVVGGLTYSRLYNDNDLFNIGVEYFYNPLGYDSPEVYPGLILPRTNPLREPATFFYLGRHYGAVFINVPAPYSWNYTTFTLSTLGNLSDQSFTTRLDYSLVLLTHLRFEAFAAIRYGRQEGEFRFGVEDLAVGSRTFNIPPSLLDLGLALRVNL